MRATRSIPCVLCVSLPAVFAAWSCPPVNSQGGALAGEPAPAVVKGCRVVPARDVSVPSQEHGVLASDSARVGQAVKQGDVLARLDDLRAKLQLERARLELHLISQRTKHVETVVRFAKTQLEVAESEYKLAVEANGKVPGSVTPEEIRRLRLTCEQAKMQIEQASIELDVQKTETARVKLEVQAAQIELARHVIRAPLSGEIVACGAEAGEWVNVGDPVCRIVPLDHLSVEGMVPLNDFSRSDVLGREVRVVVEAAKGRDVEVEGKIVSASPLIETGHGSGSFRRSSAWFVVRADVQNRSEAGAWLLQPGMSATMTVDIKPAEAPVKETP